MRGRDKEGHGRSLGRDRAGAQPGPYRAYQAAAGAGSVEALLDLAELFEDAGRYDKAEGFLALVPAGAGAWGEAQARRAEVGLWRRTEPGAVLGFLMAAEVRGGYRSLAGPLVEIEAWRQLCWDEHADAREPRARAEATERLAWLEQRALWSAAELWATFGTGPLPRSWFDQVERGAQMAPLLRRLERLGPAGGSLAERRAQTVEQLGQALREAYAQARDELQRALAMDIPDPGRVIDTTRSSGPVLGRLWPYRGEIWADETGFWVTTPSRCD
jgi:hypothetical protein